MLTSYDGDSKAQDLLKHLSLSSTAEPNYELCNGLIHHKGRLWIGDDKNLQQCIMQQFHSSAMGAILASRLLTTKSSKCSRRVASSLAPINLSHPVPLVSKPTLTELTTRDFSNHCLFHLWPGRAFPWISLKAYHPLVVKTASWLWLIDSPNMLISYHWPTHS